MAAFTGLGGTDDYEFSASQFGGVGAGVGSVGTAFNSDFGPQSQSPQKKFHDHRIESIVPITLRQALTSTKSQDETFSIDGIDVQQVTVVALLVEVKPQDVRVTLTVDDGTAQMDVLKWIPSDLTEDQKQEQRARYRENTYVRIFGALRYFDGKRHILAYSVRNVEDFNEITYHMLEAISVHKYHIAKNPGALNSFSTSTTQGIAHPGQIGGDANETDGMTPVQAAALGVILRCTSEDGVSIYDIIAECSRFSEQDVRNAVQQLHREGHVFSTLDDDHFRSSVV